MKYFVTIEQPCILSLEIEADTIDNALAIAKEKYEHLDKNTLELGTDALVMAESEDGNEVTDWNEL